MARPTWGPLAADSTFGTGGTVTTSMSSASGIDEHVWNLTLDRDGKIVAAPVMP